MSRTAARRSRSTHPDTGRKYLKAVSGMTGAMQVSTAVSLGGNKEEYIVYVAVPGMERKDFSVTIINKKLVVSAVKREALHCAETEDLSFSSWKETFVLPEDADTVMTAAVYRNGELEIHIPKGKDDAGNNPVKVVVY